MSIKAIYKGFVGRKFFIFLLGAFLSHPLFSYPMLPQEHKAEKKAGIVLGGKHIVILSSDNKKVFGLYYLGIFNQGLVAQTLRFPVLLPEGASDFEPRDGITKSDFVLGDKGALFIEKSFKPGLSLVGIDFKVPYDYDERGALEFKLPFDLEEMSFAVPKLSGIKLEAKDFKEGLPQMLSSSEYNGVLGSHLKKGSILKLSLSGFPPSSLFAQFLGLGSSVLLLLVLLAYVLLSRRKFTKETAS